MARWAVNLVRLGTDYLGTVSAETEHDAIEKAAKVFDLNSARLVLTRLDDERPKTTAPMPAKKL